MTGARVTWLGHASVLIHALGIGVLVDPVLRDRVLLLRRHLPFNGALGGRIDVVLITHAHFDHLDVPSLQGLPLQAPIIAPRGADRVLRRRLPLATVMSVEAGNRVAAGEMEVHVVESHHSGGRYFSRSDDQAVGFVLRGAGMPSIYVAGDTGPLDQTPEIGPVDVAVLPVGGWWRTLGEHHLDPAGAVATAIALEARVLIPIHWGTFHPRYLHAAVRDVWNNVPVELARHVGASGYDLDLRLLQPGTATELQVPDLHRP